jgi:putative aldouronate transport system substrate-binding protein
MDWCPIVNEKVTIDVFTVFNPPETSGTRDDAAFTAYIEDLTNVHVNWVEVIPTQNAVEKINLVLASQDLPEAFTANGVLDAESVFVNGRNGTFVPLQEAIEERMPNLQGQLERASWVRRTDGIPIPSSSS